MADGLLHDQSESQVIARGSVTFDGTAGTTHDVVIAKMDANCIVILTPGSANASVLDSAASVYVTPAAGKFTITYATTAATTTSKFFYVVFRN